MVTEFKAILVAISGGVDSVVLLDFLKNTCGAKLPVRAVHVNHQLSPYANRWQAFVERLCADQGIPLQCYCVDISHMRGGVEQAARNARYRVFEEALNDGEALVVGHHRQDQAETLLLRLLRGAGVKGMGAMVEQRLFGKGVLWRPLLRWSKADILTYAAEHQLSWVDDESNVDTRFSRNYLRHQVIPLLNQRWPQACAQLAQSASHAREAQQLLDEYAAVDLAMMDQRSEKLGQSLLLPALLNLSWSRQKHVLRYWLDVQGRAMPSVAQLEALQDLFFAKDDARPELKIGTSSDSTALYTFRRFSGRLYCLSLLPELPAESTPVAIVYGSNQLPEGGVIELQGFECIPESGLHIRYRQGGERAHPIGRAHSQTLKKLLQEFKVPPWLRNRIPLVYCNERLLAVGDYWLEQSFYAQAPEAFVEWKVDSE